MSIIHRNGGNTLDTLIHEAWTALWLFGLAACIWCNDGTLHLHRRRASATCDTCGSTLS